MERHGAREGGTDKRGDAPQRADATSCSLLVGGREGSGAEREREDARFWIVIGVGAAAVGIKVGGSPGDIASPSRSPPALPPVAVSRPPPEQ